MPVVRLGEFPLGGGGRSPVVGRRRLGGFPLSAGLRPVIWAGVRTVYSRARRGYGGSAVCPTGADSR